MSFEVLPIDVCAVRELPIGASRVVVLMRMMVLEGVNSGLLGWRSGVRMVLLLLLLWWWWWWGLGSVLGRLGVGLFGILLSLLWSCDDVFVYIIYISLL